LYTGIKTLEVTEEELSNFYSGSFKVDALINQYLLLKLNGNIVDKFRYDGSKFVKLKYRAFESQILGKIKARNIRQELYMDLLCNPEIFVVSALGVAGGGKTFLASAWALQELAKGEYQKMVIIRNHLTVPGVPTLGILPGDVTEKLKNSCMFMSDIMGDMFFDNYLNDHRIEITYLGDMRSRSISNSIILCNESQNLNTELIKMIITRVGEKSRIIFDFDLSQIDHKSFEKDNGMIALIDGLQGNPMFGMIELDHIERSAVARLAELIK
jgi:predicted ribonuclease YlaK